MADAKQILSSVELEEKDFLDILGKLIGHAKNLQNNPPDHVPQEQLAADVITKYLEPYSGDNGPLQVRVITYKAGRPNVIIKYPSADDKKVVSFVGSHMDVVPANPEEWERNPFELEKDGDKLYGRGVTDCLGHVALLTQVFKQLAEKKPKLPYSVVAVFIANEENSSEAGIGIDELEKNGELKELKSGPLYWVDSANFGPTLATGGMMGWELTVTGKKFHSGVPQKGVNAIELATEAVKAIQERFYKDFTKHADMEKKYLFEVGSSLKPTQFKMPTGSLNQIPGSAVVSGDIRFTPFYEPDEVKAKLEQYVAELDVSKLPSQGPSKYAIPDCTGKVELKFLGHPYPGVAVNLESPGFKALKSAVVTVTGKDTSFSLTGSLPIIKDLQTAGYDVQITGFGRMEAYHACNEFGYLSEFHKGAKVVSQVLQNLL